MAKKPHDDLFEKSTMTFGEHLEELRVCLFRSVVGVAVACVIGFIIANWVVRFFQSPLERAMQKYYVDRALVDFKARFNTVPVEVHQMVTEEGLLPETFDIEPAQLAEVLRLTYPERFAGLEFSPYWFTEADFLEGGAKRLCQRLASAENAADESPAGRIWQLLTESQQGLIKAIAQKADALPRDAIAQVVHVLNDLAENEALQAAPEFASIKGPDASITAGWLDKVAELFGRKPPPPTDTVAVLRGQLAERPDPEQLRRLNKLLLAGAFPNELRKARLNLLSIFTWKPAKVRFQSLNAQEPFMIWMKAALMTGLVIASPYVFYQIWIFVAAGLYPHEKNYVFLYMPISIGLFFGGASLAFVFVFDPVLRFLFAFNQGMNAEFEPRIGEWLSFVLILPLGFGISFQLPLVMLFLNRLGIASLEFYIQQWRIAILIICVISMVLTPADPVSMMLMAVPLCLLYLLGILMCRFMPRGRSPFEEAYEP
jgi:sec-independent protein translocase protein TatC